MFKRKLSFITLISLCLTSAAFAVQTSNSPCSKLAGSHLTGALKLLTGGTSTSPATLSITESVPDALGVNYILKGSVTVQQDNTTREFTLTGNNNFCHDQGSNYSIQFNSKDSNGNTIDWNSRTKDGRSTINGNGNYVPNGDFSKRKLYTGYFTSP